MNNLVLKETSNIIQYDKKLISTLKNSLYPGAKEDSIIMVIEYCRYAKLDIMLKPVHIVPMWIVDKETGKGEMRDIMMPGINLYRIQASRSGWAGMSEPEFGDEITEYIGTKEVTYPKWCKIIVKRFIGNEIVEFPAIERWKENYANSGKDKSTGKTKIEPNDMWSKRPYGQLAKCTEAQALRKAFPEIGSMPTAEEMEGKSLYYDEYNELKDKKMFTEKGIEGLKTILGVSTQEKINLKNEEILENEHKSIEQIPNENGEIPLLDFETIKWQMETALTIKQLLEVAEKAKYLPEDQKVEIRSIYREREKYIGDKNDKGKDSK